jgi:tetratricopeptide (TPR) repeat protein
MRSSHAAFERCVSICRERGFGRIEVANASMIGHCKLYLLQFRQAAEVSRAVAEQARRVGHQRAELNAMSAQQLAEFELGDLDAAMRTAKSSMALAQRLGADRFQAEAWSAMARAHLARGEIDQAAETIANALEIVERIGASFNGPRVLGVLVRQQREASARRDAFAGAERAIAAGCVGHNQYYFYRDAIEASLEAKDWSEAERYASALGSFAAADSVDWGEFYALLAAIGRGERRPELLISLTQIRDRAKALSIAAALPAIESALQRIG